jgi:hypothetical protein
MFKSKANIDQSYTKTYSSASKNEGDVFFQPKLNVNRANDIYEQEADRMADHVMQTSNDAPLSKSAQPVVQRQCQHCEEENIQRKESSETGVQGSKELDNYVGSFGATGQPLPENSRRFFEPRFGHDFSSVRIHTGTVAAKSAQSINALAYTTGSNIVFNSGLYAPESNSGKKLLAHELTHVLQQSNSSKTPSGIPNVQCKKENEPPLAAIQGEPMSSLLPKLKQLPESVINDTEAARFVGGPRLVTAINAAKAKGTVSWPDFVAGHNSELATLPQDQINDIISFLGGAKNASYYKADQLSNRFDGSVDPATGVITLFFRVRFQAMDGTRFGMAPAGTKEAEKENEEGLKNYKTDFKRVVESTWSGKGNVKPACPAAGVSSFQTRVVVIPVESGEHRLVQIFTDGAGRSNMSSKNPALPGNLQAGDNQSHTTTKQVVNAAGTAPEQVTTTQTTSAHEFGHAIQLDHPHCSGSEDNCYGVTAEERQDVMGGGDKLQVITRGGVIKHDDFAPFELIGERWGKDVFAADKLQKCNKWSAG